MHELSIAQSLIDAASRAALDAGSERVTKLNIRVGQLAGVVKAALLFSFELAADGTACEGATLSIEEMPLTVFCSVCDEPKPIADVCLFCCPDCGTPTPEILSGQELDLVSIEIETSQEASDVATRA